MDEVEQSNDAFRARKARLNRGIRKMRLERAYLLEMLGRRMKKNGGSIDGLPVYDEDSDGSSEGPPTPNGRPLRNKRSHRRDDYQSSPPPGEYHTRQQQHYYPGPYHHHSHHQHESPYGPVPNGHRPPPDYPHPEHMMIHQQQQQQHQHILPPHHHIPSQHLPPHPHTVISPVPVPSAFAMFFENNYLSQPHKHSGARTEEDLLNLAREHWDSAKFASQRGMYVAQAEKQMKLYKENARAYNMAVEQHQQEQGPQIHPKREADEGEDQPNMENAAPADQTYNPDTEDVEMADTSRPVEAAGFRPINE
ncbi:uncharacterized protein KY384_003086 [Bacidia gigantensis]|uniref:uncharacterized protein n=1 Tax=Bacidia gigantensis TaxID=2732470 RepID=UPI001D03F75A|nr:uncharacterized protein KY384_003086 [Bacidia gigantensis]KAG8531457.1 hypothetical protein KY384_003086 [Bacidia gigantensis]